MKKILVVMVDHKIAEIVEYRLDVYSYEILESGVLELRHRKSDDNIAHEFIAPGTWKTVRDL